MRSDPSDNGGLFVGRRPGTAPVHYRGLPERGSIARRRIDRRLADTMLAAMTTLSLSCWGPIPIACLWIAGQVNYLTGSVSLAILAAFVGLFALLFGALKLMRNLDEGWILVRRAAGFDQRGASSGACSRSPPCSARQPSGSGSCCSTGPATWSPLATTASEPRGEPRAMGLLDYYRQFEGLSEEEVNRELREEAAERRRKALTRVQTIDLSQTTWPDLPHANIANAITFSARRGLQLYPYLRGSELREELARRHDIDPARLILATARRSY